MEDSTITLPGKPSAPLAISFYYTPQNQLSPNNQPQPQQQHPLSDVLVVFLNGLILPRATWTPTITTLLTTRQQTHQATPALLTYDRYGQGDSPPDPTDSDTPYAHDLLSATTDLHHLLTTFTTHHLHRPLSETRLVLVGNSIGCALARLFASQHPRLISGILFLDPMMANTDFVSLFPNPDEPDFDGHQLPIDVSADDLRHARERFTNMFHPDVPNPERLDRRNLKELLPFADRPVLPEGPDGLYPRLVVVGHDWDEFAEQCEKGTLNVSKAVINAYVNPAWCRYNEGLTLLVRDDKDGDTRGQLKTAKGCGHFIQKDDPEFVAREISSLLNILRKAR